MIKSLSLASTVRYLRNYILRKPDRILHHIDGIIHVGANSGQERHCYAKYGLPVIWIEAIPSVFATLQENIRPFPKQRAIQALLMDQDDKMVDFNVANNQGGSSSIFDLYLHKTIWPEVSHSETIQLRSKTLTTLVAEEQIDLKRYNGLFMDVQGAEMLVLEGAEPIIREFKYVRTEAADFESYRNGCQLKDLRHFFKIHGFREFECTPFAHHPECGSYYEVTFKRID